MNVVFPPTFMTEWWCRGTRVAGLLSLLKGKPTNPFTRSACRRAGHFIWITSFCFGSPTLILNSIKNELPPYLRGGSNSCRKGRAGYVCSV